jgi:bifunctional pyridoxal-dependent enzyme with beta-cystathionase and maltose regulon repressor activities
MNIYEYEFDLKDFKEKMDKFKPKILTLCNPHNPGGKVFTK